MKIRRMLASILVLTMIIGLMPNTVWAVDFSADSFAMNANNSVSVDGTVDQTVNVVLSAKNTVTIIALEGVFSTKEDDNTSYLTLVDYVSPVALTGTNYFQPSSGKIVYTDANMEGFAVEENGNVMTAVYTVDKDTPTGNYTVKFNAINIQDYDFAQVENTEYTATISVTNTSTEPDQGEGDEGGSDASTEGYTAAIGSTANNVTRGDNVNVTVTVTGTYNAAELELSYPNGIMSYTGITATTNEEIDVDSNTAGKLYIVDKGTEKAGNTYTLTFTTTTVGNGNVTLDAAAFGTSEAAQTSNLTDATVSVSSVAVTVNAKTFAVTFPDDNIAGGKLFATTQTPTEGTDFTFTAANNHYTYSKVVVKVGTDESNATEVGGITGNQANGWTVPGASITGNIYVTATVTGVSYDVTYSYEDANDQTQTGTAADAVYGTNYTYTMPDGVAPSGATDGFHYEVDTITVGGAAIDNNSYTQNVSGKTVTVYGSAITGDVVITLKKVVDVADSWAVSVEADTSITAAEYSYNATVAKDAAATLTIIPATGYTYTVTAKNTTGGAAVTLTQEGNVYTTANGVTENITFVIERTVTTDGVFSTELYLGGGMGTGSQNMYLVLMSTDLGDKHYTCNGEAMYWSAKYKANCYLVIADTAPAAGSLTFAIANGEANTVDYDGDVNGTNVVDANDAQLAYDMYNKMYKTITDNVSVLKFLKADMAGEDYKLDVNDAAEIVQVVLARMKDSNN